MLFIYFFTVLITHLFCRSTVFSQNSEVSFPSGRRYGHERFYNLDIYNDGPVTLDVPVTVYASLLGVKNNDTLLFIFKDDLERMTEVWGNNHASSSFIFEDKPGIHTIQVYVYQKNHNIISGQTDVAVHEFIPGYLNLSRIIEDKDGHKYIGTGWETNITLDIHYPAYVLQDAEFAYSWTMGDDRFSNDKPFLTYQFKEPGPKWIRVAVVGRIPSYDRTNITRYKWGYFDVELTVKDPFFYLNVSGNTYLEHGQLLDLAISCNGSGPVDYCWKLLPSSGNNTTLSCTDPVTSTDCSIPILYYFGDSGEYQLAIYVSNLVTSLQRNIEVHIYDVSLRPQLSTVIIPLACSILVVIIIAAGVIIQMRRNARYSVETADFDFMRTEGVISVETSWEHMWRSLVRVLQLRCLYQSAEVDLSRPHYGTILTNNQN